MLRPVVVDILGYLLPLIIGATTFIAGRTFRRWPWLCRAGTVVVALVVVAGAGLSLVLRLPVGVSGLLSYLGGSTVLLSWVALLLLGIVWAVPGRTFSSGFLACLVAVASCLILIESAGHLWWRFFDSATWERTASKDGRLRQSSGTTCSPTAAVMLLHRYDISASEGEMAYLSGTSLFGTDAYSLARALSAKAEAQGWVAKVQFLDYEAAVRLSAPFVAHVHGESFGHAVLVERLGADHVELLDPADARRKTEAIWDGTAILLVRD